MSIIGGYTLHLYCCCRVCRDKKDAAGNYAPAVMREFSEPDKQLAFRAAKTAGWVISPKTNRCWAPGHARDDANDKPRFYRNPNEHT